MSCMQSISVGEIMKKLPFLTKLIFIWSLPFLMGLRSLEKVLPLDHRMNGASRLGIEQEIGSLAPQRRIDIDIMARTIYGEARGEKSDRALLAIGHVIMNRVGHKNWSNSPKTVVLEKAQFSCWNKNDPNCHFLQNATLDDVDFRRAYRAAIVTLNRTIDPTNGATHYHSVHLKKRPLWAKNNKVKPVGRFGNHLFYKV